jgi:hypothetical protein
MLRCMHRTNIYLTDEQVKELDERAALAGTNRSVLLREIIDREMAPRPIDPQLAAAFRRIGDVYDEVTETLFDDDPDLRIER